MHCVYLSRVKAPAKFNSILNDKKAVISNYTKPYATRARRRIRIKRNLTYNYNKGRTQSKEEKMRNMTRENEKICRKRNKDALRLHAVEKGTD